MRLYIVLFLFLIGCASVKVKTEYDRTANFDDYNTWCWLKGCELVYEGPRYLYDSALVELIGNTIALEMIQKGYKQHADSADLLLDFHIHVKEDSALFARVEREDVIKWNSSLEEYYHFLRGTLVIDIVDRSTSKVVWKSSTEKYMSLHPQLNAIEIRNSIKKALKKFPTNL